MALDKLVDSAQLDADLEDIADAIRAKSGGSGSLAFPAGFVSEIGNISGGGSQYVLKMEDYISPSVKWTMQNGVPNPLASGGCIHFKYTIQKNTNTSADKSVIAFGYGGLTAWNPGTNYPSCYIHVTKNSTETYAYFRGQGNTAIYINGFADENGEVYIKFYSSKYVDVHTGTEYAYSTDAQTFFTALASKSYLSVGQNQNDPLAGIVISLFAVEEA